MSAKGRSSARGDAVSTASSDKTEKRQRPARPKAADAPNQDTMSEMKKINWPDQETTRNLTIVVIGISVALGILLGGIDYLLVQLLGLF